MVAAHRSVGAALLSACRAGGGATAFRRTAFGSERHRATGAAAGRAASAVAAVDAIRKSRLANIRVVLWWGGGAVMEECLAGRFCLLPIDAAPGGAAVHPAAL